MPPAAAWPADETGPAPSGLLLISPQVDLTGSGESFTTNRQYANNTPEDIARCVLLYLGDSGIDPADPRVWPLFADLCGLPPTFIVAGGHDVFLDDAVALDRTARAAGVASELVVGEELWHSYPFFDCPEADAAVAQIVAFLQTL